MNPSLSWALSKLKHFNSTIPCQPSGLLHTQPMHVDRHQPSPKLGISHVSGHQLAHKIIDIILAKLNAVSLDFFTITRFIAR